MPLPSQRLSQAVNAESTRQKLIEALEFLPLAMVAIFWRKTWQDALLMAGATMPDTSPEQKTTHTFFDLASFGKRMEFALIAAMLKEGMDIYRFHKRYFRNRPGQQPGVMG